MDRHDLDALMALEKERRGRSPESLVFVGIHNLAQTRWCQMYAVLKSRRNEPELFSTYLLDRLVVAQLLGHCDRLPRDAESLLLVGEGIGLAEAEPVLLGDAVAGLPPPGDPSGEVLREGWEVELALARDVPTFRWWFPCDPYVAVGQPDGVGLDYVYEIKQARNSYMSKYVRPVGRAQGALYARFFGRARSVIDLYVREEHRIETIDEPADLSLAEEVLVTFRRVDEQGKAVPPRAWKCGSCELRDRCPLLATT